VKTGESKRSDPNKTLYIYTRVSTTVQADEGMSLDIQAEIGKERAKKLGLNRPGFELTPRSWTNFKGGP
jgi:hypothetical protein